MRLSPLNQQRFHHNRRGYWSLWIFLLSLGAELIANDKPLLVHYHQRWYLPLLVDYSDMAASWRPPPTIRTLAAAAD